MPSKTKLKNAEIAARSAALPKIPQELLDQFVEGPMTAQDIQQASMALKKALIEQMLGGELSHHPGYAPGAAKPGEASNQRNGKSAKTVLTEDGPLRIDLPRDRDVSFEPLLVPKHERCFTGFDDTIIALYAPGMTMREIQGFVRDQYGTEVSAEFISSVTDAVMEEVGAWQSRPLEPMYPVIFFDALRVKIWEDGVVRNNAIYLALGVLPDGTRDILGLWIENTEGAKFWMKVFNDLKTRGVQDVLIAVTDGLEGIPEALGAVFPATTLQTCIVHLIRNSLDFASWKDRKALAAALKPIYTAVSAEAAEAALSEFEAGPWGLKPADASRLHLSSPGSRPVARAGRHPGLQPGELREVRGLRGRGRRHPVRRLSLQHDRIAELCEQLKFARLGCEWPALAQDAARDGASFADFLERVLASEQVARDERKRTPTPWA